MFAHVIRLLRGQYPTFSSFSRAYGKHGKPDPEPEPESGTGTGTGNGTGIGEINECFKLGSMIHIKTPPPFSAFLARWMMIRGTLLRKGTCT